MKILIIRTFPSILNPKGYNIQEIGFAKALVRRGVTCDVVLYNGRNKDREELIEVYNDNSVVGYVKVFLRHGFGILKNGFFPGLNKLVTDYDILQVHEYDQISSWLYYGWNKKKKVVIYHGPYFDEFNKGYNLKCKVFDNTFLRIRQNKDTLCFTKSNAAADFLKNKGFKNAFAIGVGLDLDNFETETERICTKDNSYFNIIYVGKLEPRRNSLFLLDVIEKVSANNSDIRFTIIGDGEKEYANQWLNKARKLIDKGVLAYFKKKTQSELKDIYKQMDLMVFPSNYEIFGMVLLEAMYFNLPVVSSNNGGSDTLITDGVDGIILDGFDVDIWSDKLMEIAGDKLFYNKIRASLESKDHEIYTWDGIAKNYLDILNHYFEGK